MNLSRIGMVAVVGLGIGVLSVGCSRREEQALGTERERTVTPAPQTLPDTPRVDQGAPYGAQPGAQDMNQGQVGGASPAAMIAQARCEQMQRCQNIGTDKKYGDMSSCLSTVRSDWAEDLNTFECAGGFDHKELNECLSEIRTEGCDNPIAKLGSFVACRPSDICKNF